MCREGERLVSVHVIDVGTLVCCSPCADIQERSHISLHAVLTSSPFWMTMILLSAMVFVLVEHRVFAAPVAARSSPKGGVKDKED